jgi:putative transposase
MKNIVDCVGAIFWSGWMADSVAIGFAKGLLPKRGRRRPRVLGRPGKSAVYHVVSRTCGQEFLLGAVEKKRMRDLIGRVAAFCGVEMLTYCILDNHFHLLVEVPGEVGELSDAELIRRAGYLYGGKLRPGQPLTLAMVEGALALGGETRTYMRDLLMRRMGSLPMFVKVLKQRFSIGYNRLNERKGTLWEGPFRSVLVENSREALAMVGAYIDLNAVRAGIVEDPKDYRFCGYGEAVGKGKLTESALLKRLAAMGFGVEAQTGNGVVEKWRGGEGDAVEAVLRCTREETKRERGTKMKTERERKVKTKSGGELVEAAGRLYRLLMFEEATDGSASEKGRVLARAAFWKVNAEGGGLSRGQLLRCRIRYLTEGAVIGSRAFVEDWFLGVRGTFGGRQTGARPMKGGDFGDLCSLRDLRDPLG